MQAKVEGGDTDQVVTGSPIFWTVVCMPKLCMGTNTADMTQV